MDLDAAAGAGGVHPEVGDALATGQRHGVVEVPAHGDQVGRADDVRTEIVVDRPAGFSRLLAPLMAPAMRRANRKDLARLKDLLERPAG